MDDPSAGSTLPSREPSKEWGKCCKCDISLLRVGHLHRVTVCDRYNPPDPGEEKLFCRECLVTRTSYGLPRSKKPYPSDDIVVEIEPPDVRIDLYLSASGYQMDVALNGQETSSGCRDFSGDQDPASAAIQVVKAVRIALKEIDVGSTEKE